MPPKEHQGSRGRQEARELRHEALGSAELLLQHRASKKAGRGSEGGLQGQRSDRRAGWSILEGAPSSRVVVVTGLGKMYSRFEGLRSRPRSAKQEAVEEGLGRLVGAADGTAIDGEGCDV